MPDPGLNRPKISWGGVCLDCADAEEMARFCDDQDTNVIRFRRAAE